jgi:hypothetical protein
MGSLRRRLAREGRGAILTAEELRDAKQFGVYSPLARAKTIRKKTADARRIEYTLEQLAKKGQMRQIKTDWAARESQLRSAASDAEKRQGKYTAEAQTVVSNMFDQSVKNILAEEKKREAEKPYMHHEGITEAEAVQRLREINATPGQLKKYEDSLLRWSRAEEYFNAKAKRLGLGKEEAEQMYRLWRDEAEHKSVNYKARLPALNQELMRQVFDARAKRLGLTKEQANQMYGLWLIEQGAKAPAKATEKGAGYAQPLAAPRKLKKAATA